MTRYGPGRAAHLVLVLALFPTIVKIVLEIVLKVLVTMIGLEQLVLLISSDLC